MKPKNVAVVLYDFSHIRNFLSSNALVSVTNSSYFLTRLVYTTDLLEKNDLGMESQNALSISKYMSSLSTSIELAYLWRFRSSSMNHLIRANLALSLKKNKEKWTCVAVNEFRISLSRRIFVRGLALLPNSCLKTLILLGAILAYPRQRTVFQGVDLVVMPFPGHIGNSFTAIAATCKFLKIPVMLLQENWDHISTKSFVIFEPSVIAVWGRQSKGHVRAIQRLIKTKVHILGSPRFSSYADKSTNPSFISAKKNQIMLESKYILLTGSTSTNNDIKLIELMNKWVLNHPNLRIVYRIHPRLVTNELLWSKIGEGGLVCDFGGKYFFHGQLEELVKHSSAVINLLSTLTLEALACGVPVCVPTFVESKKYAFSFDDILDSWSHLQGVRILPNLCIAESESDLFDFLDRSAVRNTGQKLNEELKYFVEPADYRGQLEILVRKTLDDSQDSNGA